MRLQTTACLLLVCSTLLNCSRQEEQGSDTYEYLSYRAYDKSGSEVERPNFNAETVFMAARRGQPVRNKFRIGAGRCEDLLRAVKQEHVILAYSAYMSGDDAQGFAKVRLSCMAFLGYDSRCVADIDEAIESKVREIEATRSDDADRAAMVGLVLAQQEKIRRCGQQREISARREFALQ